uniref:Cystatin domain-containing protein n=1 Tax=Parastrongyloides trichosuri TaxID=131310 RepID=A0A0N5A6I5_PARTI
MHGYYIFLLFIFIFLNFDVIDLISGKDSIGEEEWKEKIEQGLRYYNSKSDSDYLSGIVKIISKNANIVDGVIYNFEMIFQETKCLKIEKIDKINESKCSFIDNGKKKVALIEIYVSPNGDSDEISILGVKDYN